MHADAVNTSAVGVSTYIRSAWPIYVCVHVAYALLRSNRGNVPSAVSFVTSFMEFQYIFRFQIPSSNVRSTVSSIVRSLLFYTVFNLFSFRSQHIRVSLLTVPNVIVSCSDPVQTDFFPLEINT